MGEREQREIADRVLGPQWEQSLKDRLETGMISPTIEGRLMDYKYGKPVERKEIVVRSSLEGLSLMELSARAKQIALLLDKLEERNQADDVKLLEAGDIVEAEAVEVTDGPTNV